MIKRVWFLTKLLIKYNREMPTKFLINPFAVLMYFLLGMIYFERIFMEEEE